MTTLLYSVTTIISMLCHTTVIIEVALLILTSEVTIVLYGQQYKVTLLVGINKATPVITSSLISV